MPVHAPFVAPRRWRRLARPAAGCLLALMAACGTTVPTSQQPTSGLGVDNTGATSTAGPLSGGAPGSPERHADTAAGSPLAGPAGSAAGSAAPSGVTTGGSAPLPAVSAAGAPVKIGVMALGNTAAIFDTVGVKASSYSNKDMRAIWQVAANEVNAHGGLAGHKIVLSYYFIDVTQGTFASRSAQACAQFTQDEKVFAVVMDGAIDGSMAACLAKHRTPGIDLSQESFPYDASNLKADAPYLYLPGRINMSRFSAYVDVLASHGFFSKDSKVGLVRYDVPNQQRTEDTVIRPALQRHGLKLDSSFAFTQPQNASDLGYVSSQASSAVLQFKTAGVNRVLFLGNDLVLDTFFPKAAESQRYRPRYGLTTDDGPDYFATNAPAGQMTGAMGVGWEPAFDLPKPNVAAVMKGNSLWATCASRFSKAGFPTLEAYRCTTLFFLQRALAGAPQLTAALLRAGADKLGNAPYTTSSFGTDWAPGRYDGPAQVRVLSYSAGCTCFAYSSPPTAAP